MAGSKYCNDDDDHRNYGHRGDHSLGNRFLDHMGDELDLSDAQKDQIEAIMSQSGSDSGDARKELMELRIAVMELDPNSGSYQADLNTLAEEAAEMARSKTLYHGKLKQQRPALGTESLDERSYYQLLGVERSADAPSIGEKYYQLVKVVHPDRHGINPPAGGKMSLVHRAGYG